MVRLYWVNTSDKSMFLFCSKCLASLEANDPFVGLGLGATKK